MSAFVALNIEYDNVSEPEVDDTKELQIEDALKLYQTALKFHSEGPQSYEQALEAYTALFQSEIFKYPESQSELRRFEAFPEYEELWIDGLDTGPVQLAAPAESAPNTLPQIIHLSYKNHGQFLLDLLQYRIQQHIREAPGTPLAPKQIGDSARAPLNYYSEALDKDDTDVDLWRCTSAVATLVGSNRIARFCLEAVLDMGEDNDLLGLSGIEQTIALQRLQELARSLQDDLSLLVGPLSSFRRKKLGEALRKRLETHPFIPKPSFESTAYSVYGNAGRPPTRYMITAPRRDWAAVGEVILQQQNLMEIGLVDTGPGVGLGVNLPEPTAEQMQLEAPPTGPSPPPAPLPPKDPELEPQTEVLPPPKEEPSPPLAENEAENPAEDAEPIEDVQMKETDVPEPPQEESNGEPEIMDDAKAEAAAEEQEPLEIAAANEDSPDQAELSQVPGRKRSVDSAGLAEAADGGRVRSKRIRNRETLDGAAVDGAAVETKGQNDWQLQELLHADSYLFEVTNVILGKLQASCFGTPQDIHAMIKNGNEAALTSENTLQPAIMDFYGFARSCPPEMASLLVNGVNGESIDTLGAISRETGLNAFLSHNKSRDSQSCVKSLLGSTDGLLEWLQFINGPFTYNKDAAWHFLITLLKPGSFPGRSEDSQSSYLADLWPDDLKRIVVQVAVRFDEYVYPLVEEKLSSVSDEALRIRSDRQSYVPTAGDLSLIEMVQTLFELHLDVYSLIKRPGSNVDEITKIQQKDRLERWSALANSAVNLRISGSEDPRSDELALRHIWATAFHISVCDNVSQSHVLACMKDLKSLLTSLDEPVIQLQNNAVIPEISMAAVEQELSKINMKDFFVKVFSDRDDDPVTTIESLEPLLEWSVQSLGDDVSNMKEVTDDGGVEDKEAHLQDESMSNPFSSDPSPQEQMSQFLANATWSLRLSLWQRLRQAYMAIDYPPKVVSCHLRSIELLTNEMKSSSYLDTSGEPRGLQLVRWLHLIDEFIKKLLMLERTATNIYECVDSEHLRTSLDALTSLLKVLHTFTLYEDQLRVGSFPSPTFEGRPKPSFTNTAKWVHNIQLRAWMLLYSLIKEGIEQNPEAFEAPAELRFTFLRDLHYAMGVHRTVCNAANKDFLHLLMNEFLQLSDIDRCDLQLSQVLLDLYGLKCAWDPAELVDHGCIDHELINRNVAQKLLGFLMSQAQKVPMKDLPRTELKTAIDKVHGCLSRGKNNDDIILNRRVFTQYMKSTVNPLDLFAALRGTLELPTKVIPPSAAPVAAQGWYFLMGLIALSKFKSQKRLQAGGPTEDLNIAVAFFTQDLEYSTEQWETWYRLAQANELHLEEHVAWSAEKLNNGGHEVFFYQRAAIHCYTMAVSCAVRSGDVNTEMSAKMAEMYSEFGNRIYSSSREPFSMAAFAFRENEEKHFSGESMYKRPPHNPLRVYTAWKFASVLFKRSLARAPNKWTNHFMLAKCLWKMYNASDEIRGPQAPPTMQEVVDSCVRAIETLPKRDSRKEPILEPHYKLVSIVHKLVQRKDLTTAEAVEILKVSSYTKKVPVPESPENDAWVDYVTATLKALRAADKSGWHHRMTMRAARLIYDDAPENPVAAMSVKHELTQQMFTKTMVLQVWRPENERSGRHFVYTTRYLRFFAHILVQLGDRENLELLAKRLRRKNHEFFDHTQLWQETCLVYLRMLRKAGNVPESYEDHVFKSLNHEEFTQKSTRLEIWCHNPNNQSVTRDVLQEVIELKKMNNGLMKPTLIDDLLGDAYAKLYEEVGPELDAIELPKPEPPPTPQHKPMALTSVMNLDGAADQPGPMFQPGYVPGEHVPKPRAKGVGRRELQRKAEAAVSRPAAATSTSMPIRSTPQATPIMNQQVQVVIPVARSSFENGPPGTAGPSAQHLLVPEDDGAEVSAPTSIHEDADDESELSELNDEDIEDPSAEPAPRPLFPNLMAKVPRNEAPSEASAMDVDSEGKKEAEEDEQPRA